MTATDLFGIGSSGTRAYQAAMGVISNNIANADTPGYSRRTIELKESPSGTGTTVWYRSGIAYGGVDIGKIVRASDPYLDAAARQTTNMLGSADQRARWMTDIQTALNDGSLGVGQRMTNMFSAVERLASNPADTTLRADVLFSFEQINTAFKQSSTDLTQIKTGIGAAATNDVAALNDALQQLADANEGLRRSPAGTAAHISLLDSRDQALGEISKRLNVDIDFSDHDVANVSYGSVKLVDNIVAAKLGVSQDSAGILSFTSDSVAIADPTGGTLGGLTTSATITKSRIDDLNSLAAEYVSAVNSWHKQGQTAPPASTAGTDMLSGTDANSLQVLITDPAKIAAASTSGVSNGNLLTINSIRGTGSFEDKWVSMVATHGNLVGATLAEQTAAGNRDTMAQQARGDVSGINLDREAADLLRFQQAYQGCARIIQMAKEIMDTIFQIF
jgi:flagellar hook-associated protein 1 FlgK